MIVLWRSEISSVVDETEHPLTSHLNLSNPAGQSAAVTC